MRKKKEEIKENAGDKILDVTASMRGTLCFGDPVNLRINGKFEGTLDTKGMLMVGEKADIKADIKGESISIAGQVVGNIKAETVLKLEGNARLNGDIETPRISIAEGAILNGQVTMTQGEVSTDSSKADWMTTDQLARYLEVEETKISEWASNDMLPGTKESGEWVFEKSKVDQWIAEGKVKA